MIVLPLIFVFYALLLLDAGFVLMTGCVLLANNVPCLKVLLKYGKTLQKGDLNARLNRFLGQLYVPKSFFKHFYVLDLIFCSANIYILKYGFKEYLQLEDTGEVIPRYSAIGKHQFQILASMMFLQSSRRVYECFYVSKFSNTAKIHVSHYLVGCYFYLGVNLEPLLCYLLGHQSGNIDAVNREKWPLLDFFAIILFSFASIDQYENHLYLSHLVKYNVPRRRLFRYLSCPHYLDEILIYLSCFLVLRTAESFLVFAWTLVNLSCSANQSYQFYTQKSEDLKQRTNYWRILPFLY